jgi:chromosome partitioning protein
MRTVAIINQKGGCGKTTTSINLAACLARWATRRCSSTWIPQGHCGVGLAVPEEQIERTIYDALIEPSATANAPRIGQIVWQIASDFDLAPPTSAWPRSSRSLPRPGRDDRLRRPWTASKTTINGA